MGPYLVYFRANNNSNNINKRAQVKNVNISSVTKETLTETKNVQHKVPVEG